MGIVAGNPLAGPYLDHRRARRVCRGLYRLMMRAARIRRQERDLARSCAEVLISVRSTFRRGMDQTERAWSPDGLQPRGACRRDAQRPLCREQERVPGRRTMHSHSQKGPAQVRAGRACMAVGCSNGANAAVRCSFLFDARVCPGLCGRCWRVCGASGRAGAMTLPGPFKAACRVDGPRLFR